MKRSKSFRNYFYAGGKPVLENVFFVLALVIGSAYLLLTPPCASPDEQNHFYKGWSVSQGNFFAQRTPDHRLGDSLPVSLLSLPNPMPHCVFVIRAGLLMVPLNPLCTFLYIRHKKPLSILPIRDFMLR